MGKGHQRGRYSLTRNSWSVLLASRARCILDPNSTPAVGHLTKDWLNAHTQIIEKCDGDLDNQEDVFSELLIRLISAIATGVMSSPASRRSSTQRSTSDKLNCVGSALIWKQM